MCVHVTGRFPELPQPGSDVVVGLTEEGLPCCSDPMCGNQVVSQPDNGLHPSSASNNNSIGEDQPRTAPHQEPEPQPVQIHLRGDDEVADKDAMACRVCLVNKKAVISTCCGALSTCVACAQALYSSKRIGDVQCPLCRANVTVVCRVSWCYIESNLHCPSCFSVIATSKFWPTYALYQLPAWGVIFVQSEAAPSVASACYRPGFPHWQHSSIL